MLSPRLIPPLSSASDAQGSAPPRCSKETDLEQTQTLKEHDAGARSESTSCPSPAGHGPHSPSGLCSPSRPPLTFLATAPRTWEPALGSSPPSKPANTAQSCLLKATGLRLAKPTSYPRDRGCQQSGSCPSSFARRGFPENLRSGLPDPGAVSGVTTGNTLAGSHPETNSESPPWFRVFTLN